MRLSLAKHLPLAAICSLARQSVEAIPLHLLLAAGILAASLSICSTSHATVYLPSVKIGTAALINPGDGDRGADAYYGTATTSSDGLSHQTGVPTPTPPEIVELARALKGDPDLIYQYVRNNIQTVWMYGLQKGALGAEIDKSGTPFDQAELMVALLTQAGPGFDPRYEAGMISLTKAQFSAWTNITRARAACQLLSSGGIPAIINGTTATTCDTFGSTTQIVTVQMAHIWVRVTIAGTNYFFDPSYKPYTWKPGIDLAAALNFTPGDPLSKALIGWNHGTDPSGAPFVNSLNANQLNTALKGYASSFLGYLQDQHLQGAQMDDIVGGGVIIPDYSTLRNTALPYADTSIYTPHQWTPASGRYNAIPNQYRTTLEADGEMLKYTDLSHSHYDTMFDVTFYVDEIYGRALTVDTDYTQAGIAGDANNYRPNIVTLKFDGQALANVPAYTSTMPSDFGLITARGLPSHIILTANHPYAASASGTPVTDGDYMDDQVDKPVVLISALTIVHGWGDVSAALFSKWSDERASDTPLPKLIISPLCNFGHEERCVAKYSQPAGDFQREKTAANWLAQYTRAAQLHAAIAGSVQQLHHALGFVYADTAPLIPTFNDPPPALADFVEADSFDRIDVDLGLSLTSKVDDTPSRRAAILSIAASAAALEGSISAQMSDLPDTSSTATRFAWANSPPSDHSAGGQNPAGLGPQNFYQFDASTASAAAGLAQVDGATLTTADGISAWNAPPEIGVGEFNELRAALSDEISSYANSSTRTFTVVAAQEAFIGPGQRGGAIHVYLSSPSGAPLSYYHDPAKQRGGAFVATRYDDNGDPLEIAHIVLGLSPLVDGTVVVSKGGGGGVEPTSQASYNPSEAADILKSRFVDKSSELGVDLSKGSLTYSSPAMLRVGNGGFPYELTASLAWRAAPPPPTIFGPVSPSQPHPGWTTNWHNNLAVSGSGMEAMGQSDIRAAAGTIAAFYAEQDVYSAAQSPQREVTGVLTQAWWADQIAGNVVTVSEGAGTRQFVKLADASWILPGTGFAKLAQTGDRVPFEQICSDPGPPQPYALTRGWDPSAVSFAVTNAHGDKENFANWLNVYPTDSGGRLCGNLRGFRLASWTFPQGAAVGLAINLSYAPFTSVDQISEVVNSLGRKIDFTNGTGILTGLTNGLGGGDARSVVIAATAADQVDIPSMTDPAGDMTKFTYTAPQGQSDTTRPVPYQQLNKIYLADNLTDANTQYIYDTLGRVQQMKDAENLQVGDRDPYNFFIADGTLGTREDPLNKDYTVVYDTYGHPSIYIDERGNQTNAIFDSRGRVFQYTYPEQDAEQFDYDDHNNTTSYIRFAKPGCTVVCSLTVTADWDQTWNKPLTITDARGNDTTFTYYAAGSNGASLLHAATRPQDSHGNAPVYSFTYDANGRMLKSIVPVFASSNIVTQNTYDATENLTTTEVDPSGLDLLTRYNNYDANGDVGYVINPRGKVSDFLYDLDRRKTETHHHDGGLAADLISAERMIYDAVGRVLKGQQASSMTGTVVNTWRTMAANTYTPTGKVATVTDADNRTTTNAYDGNDRLQMVTDPVGRKSTFAYNGTGQLTLETRGVGSAIEIQYSRTTYGDNGEQQTVKDANGNETDYVYDPFVRLAKTIYPDSSTDQITLYDANGNIRTRVNRGGGTLTYTYDKLNRLLTEGVPAYSGNPAVVTSWDYTQDGRVSDVSDDAFNDVDYSYDSAGRRTGATTKMRFLPPTGSTKTVSYNLNANGDRTRLTYPDGFYVNYTYDSLDRMATAVDSTSATLATYTYDPFSRRTNLAYGNGAGMAYSYSDAGDLLSLTQNFTSSGDTFHTTLTYTDAHQLETEDIGKPAYVWQPAANGTDSYGAANGVNQYPSVHFAGVSNQTYTYDNKANLQNDGTFAYVYNPENLLMSATSAATSATYAYDPLGRRQQKVVNGTSTWYLNDGDMEIAEYNNAGNLARRYIPGPAIDDYIEVIPTTGSAKFFHTDHHGSVVAMSGPTGAPLEGPYTYDAYGNVNDTSGTPIKYTGRRIDPETGLYYYRARYYSPKLGRFLQTDPVGYVSDLNLYTYVGNDPTDKTDPTGNDALMVINPDGTRTLVIPVSYTGSGASPADIAKVANSITVTGSTDTIKVVPTSTPIQGVLNHMDVSPGYDNKTYPLAGEGQKAGPGPEGTGGNEAHINSTNNQANQAAAHDTFHFGGLTDKYVEGPKDAAGNRTSVPSPGYSDSNIMTSRSGTTINQSQFNEALKNPTTKMCTVTKDNSCN